MASIPLSENVSLHTPQILPPGSCLGMLGGGQLGRMFASVARRMGYHIHIFGDTPDGPAGQLSDHTWNASFTDVDQLEQFAAQVDVVTYEQENIPVSTVEHLQTMTRVFPGRELLRMSQHRRLEKSSLNEIGIPTAEFRSVTSAASLVKATADFHGRGILKTATLGYDGKGQIRISPETDLVSAWESLKTDEAILEREISFDFEISIVAARFQTGECRFFPPVLNHHVNHILDLSVSPSPLINPAHCREAEQIAQAILEHFDVIGVLCVEFFVTTDGRLLVNEIAPRPHNSGHLTIEACPASQFEQQVRAVCGWAAGDVRQLRPAAMANLLGDHLMHTTPEQWSEVFAMNDVHVHLYGKSESRIGRKMGHLTCLADTARQAEERVLHARSLLTSISRYDTKP
ncbi:MAG: 5-(carboxyamino)imidazole ribonucleotide synthase [Planctomycetaceae bacterium]|nr:5-(carboxyamino)imidazole ribonucleotide synthase [Planctomycetaceae bacterium]